MDNTVARKMWRTLESYHAMIYFVPEAARAYKELGLKGQSMGYFASRAAAMGPVPADVVIATFYNFSPELVRRAIPDAWRFATPEAILTARLAGVDAALRRMLGDAVESPEVVEAAGLAREATVGCTPEGRPLYAAHAALPWPDAPHLALWHAVTLLREYRGDGHVAALLLAGLDGAEAAVSYAATGESSMAGPMLQRTRGWSDEAWAAAGARLRARGLLDADGAPTEVGREARAWVEDKTDARAIAPWERLGDASSERLRTLVRPLSKAIVDAGTFGG